MTLNFDAPAKVVTKYQSSDGLIHSCSFHVKPTAGTEGLWALLGESLGSYPIDGRDGTSLTVNDAVGQFWHGQGGVLAPDGFRTMFSTTTNFLTVSIFRYLAGTNTPVWTTEVDFDYAGTSIIAMTPNSQHTWVGKGAGGEQAKLVFLDVGSGNQTSFVSRGSFNANQNEMNWALTHSESAICTRGGSFWKATRGYWGGQNEAVFRKRHRA